MTRRELLINWGRVALLRWRLVRGRALRGSRMGSEPTHRLHKHHERQGGA